MRWAFPQHTAFYRDLETHWDLAAQFALDADAEPEIVIYRNPDRAKRSREDLLDPALYRRLGRFSAGYDRQFLAQLGSLFGRKGWYAKAVHVCTWQLRIDPENPTDALNRLGYFDYMRGEYRGAIDAWELAVRADSAKATVHANLGAAYFRTGDTTRAVAILKRGIREVPTDPEIPLNLATIRWKQDQSEAAIKVLEDALTRFSMNLEIHETLAAIHGVLGDSAKGVTHDEAAIRLAPDREDLRERLQALQPPP